MSHQPIPLSTTGSSTATSPTTIRLAVPIGPISRLPPSTALMAERTDIATHSSPPISSRPHHEPATGPSRTPHHERAGVHRGDQSSRSVKKVRGMRRARRHKLWARSGATATTRGRGRARQQAPRPRQSLPASCPGWLRTVGPREHPPRPAPSHRQPSRRAALRRTPRRHEAERGTPSSRALHPPPLPSESAVAVEYEAFACAEGDPEVVRRYRFDARLQLPQPFV